MAPGECELRVSAKGYAAVTRVILPPTHREYRIVLTPGAVVAGKVVWKENEIPVSFAQVVAEKVQNFGLGTETDEIRVSTLSGIDGSFSLSELQPGRYKIYAMSEDGHGSVRDEIEVGLSTIQTGVRIAFEAAATLRGRVLLGDTQRPCTAGFVAVQDSVSQVSYRGPIQSDGRVSFYGLTPDHTHQVAVGCEGRVQSQYQEFVSPADFDERLWMVQAGAELFVHVKNEIGQAMSDSHVSLQPAKGVSPDRTRHLLLRKTTDTHGNVHFSGLSAEQYHVHVHGKDHPRETLHYVSVRDDEASEVTVTVGRPAGLRGVVVDESGVPAAGARVVVTSMDWPKGEDYWSIPQFEALSLEDGQFSINNIQPGEYGVWVMDDDSTRPIWTSGPGRTSFIRGSPIPRREPQAEVKLLAGTVEETRLVVARGHGSIRGRIVDEDGYPVGDVRVFAMPTEMLRSASRPSERYFDLSDIESGAFEIHGLSTKRSYAVVALASDAALARVDQVKPDATIEIRIPPTASIRGYVKTVSEQPLPGARLSLYSSQGQNLAMRTAATEQASFSFRGLNFGTYWIVAHAKDYFGYQKVQVSDRNHSQSIVLHMHALVAMSGFVLVSETKSPPDLAMVQVELSLDPTRDIRIAVAAAEVHREDGLFRVNVPRGHLLGIRAARNSVQALLAMRDKPDAEWMIHDEMDKKHIVLNIDAHRFESGAENRPGKPR